MSELISVKDRQASQCQFRAGAHCRLGLKPGVHCQHHSTVDCPRRTRATVRQIEGYAARWVATANRLLRSTLDR